MKNITAINSICTQLIKSCEKIQAVNSGMAMIEHSTPELLETYDGIRFDELEHTQVLVLNLTQLVTASSAEDENMDDGSAFGPGELTAVQGEKKNEEDE